MSDTLEFLLGAVCAVILTPVALWLLFYAAMIVFIIACTLFELAEEVIASIRDRFD